MYSVNITAITIVTGRGPDKLSLKTNLRNPFEQATEEFVVFDLTLPCGDGKEFARHFFPSMRPEIVDVNPTESKFGT